MATGLSLNNAGDDLVLADALGNVIDRTDTALGWHAGSNATKATMERIDPEWAGGDPSNWADNDGVTTNGTDSGGLPIIGTPLAQNSVYTPGGLPPGIAFVLSPTSDGLIVIFDEPVDATSAGNPANYQVDGARPSSAVATSSTRVILGGIGGLTAGSIATIVVTGVLDMQGNASDDSATFYVDVMSMATVQVDDATGYPTADPDAWITTLG